MDLVDFTEPVLQAMRDPSYQRFAENRFNVVVPSDPHEISEGDDLCAGFARASDNPALDSRHMFFVQGAHHPRT